MPTPLVIDLFAGLGGFSAGFIAEGWRAVGFDIERHIYGDRRYPGELVLQDVLTLHGSQFKDAACIVASPPCQEYSYMAMPWSRAKQIAGALKEECPFPMKYSGSRSLRQLNALFDACFRIQREASEAAGRCIPMVVENVKGAQPWVGRARANYGSFYLWGDVDSIGSRIVRAGDVRFGAEAVKAAGRLPLKGGDRNKNRAAGHLWSSSFADTLSKWHKNNGSSWFNIGSPGQTNVGQNPDGRKVPGFNFHKHENGVGRSFQSAAVAEGRKGEGGGWFGDYQAQKATQDGVKQGEWWHDPGSMTRRFSPASPARKAASAQIAKIPEPLARHIARIFKPEYAEERSA